MTKNKAQGTGMAMVLVFLIIGLMTQNLIFFKIAVPLLLLNMIAPMIFYPIAIVWFGLSQIIGLIVPKIILSIIYLLLVIPVGLLRKLFRKDTLQLKKFKYSNESVMKIRKHEFSTADIENPY